MAFLKMLAFDSAGIYQVYAILCNVEGLGGGISCRIYMGNDYATAESLYREMRIVCLCVNGHVAQFEIPSFKEAIELGYL